jgi:hypothetical protein
MELTLTRQPPQSPPHGSPLRLVADNGVILLPAGRKNLEEVGSQLVLALESSYNALRREFPQVEVKPGQFGHIPEAVIVISSSATKYGHYARSRWTVEEHQLPEIMISAEGLKRPPRDVLGTLIHEAAHGIAATAGVDDVDKKGKYHNRVFRNVAEELGLQVEQHPDRGNLGHANTSVPEGEFDDLVEVLTPKLVAYREFDVVAKPVSKRTRELSLRCACEPVRTARMFPAIFDLGPILCGVCGEEFYEK